jgi:hypothetical protein
MIKKLVFFHAIVFTSVFSGLKAQDDLLALIKDSTMPDAGKAKVFATFKTTRLINTQTTETVKKRTMDFRITHRFGNIGASSNGGGHTLYGLDIAQDIRFSFDFGITSKLQIGVGRSRVNELLDGSVKWKFLEQTVNNKIPVSVCLFGSVGFTPQKESSLYPSNAIIENRGNIAHRVNYFSQLIIARKFGERFSMQILPAFHYRNFIVANVNASNGNAVETNGLLVIGTGGRIKITKRFAIIADYYYIVSKYRQNNTAVPFENPFAIGVEIETGGHVFHLTFTNASGIVENNFIPNTNDRWFKGGFKFGFDISRVFNL